MPKYDYECKKCGKVLSVRHSVSETPDLDSDCNSDKCDMEKIPSVNTRLSKVDRVAKTGQVVKDNIALAKEEVRLQKKELKKDY